MTSTTNLSIVSKPVSLEDQCFLHLVCNLEEYLPERLASLPLHFRQKLLLNLPAADVFQLEKTAVTAGIDMEETIWKVLGEKRSWRYGNGTTYVEKPTLLACLCSDIINGYLEGARQLLFSASGYVDAPKDIPLRLNSNLGDFLPNYSPTPHRHVRHFQKECQQTYLMSHLVNDYQKVPVVLSVNSHSFARSELWKERHSRPIMVLLTKFFERIETLELSEADERGRFILEQALSNQQGTLKHLKFALLTGDTVSGVAQLLSPESVGVLPRVSTALRKALGRSSDTVRANPNLPYGGLASIKVSIVAYTKALDHHLCSVISYQVSLSLVELRVIELDVPSIALVSMLSSLFHRPQFKKLSLTGFTIPGKHFSIILPQFLSAPSGDHEKVLCFLRVAFTGLQIPQTSTVTAAVCGDVLPRKALILDLSRTTPHQLPVAQNTLFNCLLAYDYTQLLSSLSVTGSGPGHPMQSMRNVFPTVTTLQHLCFTGICLFLLLEPEAFFVNLFQSPHIKSVHLKNCFMVGATRLVPALTLGLREQVSVGSLEELLLVENHLVDSKESDLHGFFDVLFSLPQLPKLKLDVRCNGFSAQHFAIMYESWRRNAVSSLKQLKIYSFKWICDECGKSMDEGGHGLQYQVELKDIAVSGDYLAING